MTKTQNFHAVVSEAEWLEARRKLNSPASVTRLAWNGANYRG